MTQLSPQRPFDILQTYESRMLANISVGESDDETANKWVGIGFRLGDDLLVVSMAEVVEILDTPECTRAPRTQPWFLGIANVRGNLLPLMDLHGFMLGGRASNRRNARLLVHNRNGIYAGFKVDDILGIKHFNLDEATAQPPHLHDSLIPYIEQTFTRDDQDWPVFSLEKLAASDAFLQIAK
jgi:twitching motility protein PilI